MTTGAIAPTPILQFFDNAGNPAVGGSVLTQIGGSNANTYQDVGLVTPLPNPIPLNSRGEVSLSGGNSSQCFLTPNVVYSFTLFDADGNQLWVASYVNGFVIDQAAIGQALWPQSAEELNAGITPTNYAFPWANVMRYGADPTQTTECSDAFVQGWTAYKTIYAPTGSYLVDPIIPPVTLYQRTLYGDGAGVGRTQLVANGNDDVIQLSNGGVAEHTITLRDFGIQGPGTNVPVTFTGAVLTGATSATLRTIWALSSSTWNVTFSNGEVRIVSLTNGATTAAWTGALGADATSAATTGGAGIHVPSNAAVAAFTFHVSDVTINGMGGPGLCDHLGMFTSQYERVQVNNCLDNLFDMRGGNTDTYIGCYAQGIVTGGKCGYRIHGGRPTMIGCNGINTAGSLGLAQRGMVFSDLVADDGRSSFCVPTLIGCNVEDASIIGIQNKNGGIISIDSQIQCPAAGFTVTFSGTFSGGETSGTLAGAWAHLGGNYYVEFSSGDVRIVALTEGDTTATWGTVLSGAATASANTNTVALLVNTVNAPGYVNDLNALIQTKGSTFANGVGIHTRSNNTPFYFAGNTSGESWSFYDDTGAALYTMGSMTKAVALVSGRNGMAFGDSVFKTGLVAHQRMDTRVTVTYSASMTPDMTLGNIQEITANDGSAFTINAPTGMVSGQTLTLLIKNTSGGALGTATFNAALHLAGSFTAPATGNNRSIIFYYNNSTWYETSRAAADVAN